jgi:DNA-binding LytR/AlgR family response regulator
LLKPITLIDLQFAIDKFEKQKKIENSDLISSIAMAYQQINKNYKTRFLVKLGQTIDSIPTEEIHHFETKDSLSFLVTNKGNHFPIDYTLDQLETQLQPQNFFRINRKIILHIQSIEKVSSYFNSRLSITSKFLVNDARIVSRERVNDFKKWLDN